ncbi:MAG: DinB family protein [Chloroflexota bacterium]
MTDRPGHAEEDDLGRLAADLAAFPEDLGRLLAEHPREALVRPASGGGWGVVEVLCHLLDWEEIFLARIKTVLAHDLPALPAYDGALWDIERDYRSQDPELVLARFRQARASLAATLAGIEVDAWQRAGDHAVHGRVTIEWLARHLRHHSQEHLDQIREALA